VARSARFAPVICTVIRPLSVQLSSPCAFSPSGQLGVPSASILHQVSGVHVPASDSVMAGVLHLRANGVKGQLARFTGGTSRLSEDHFITNAILFC
jgi:hypothetical protein